MSGETEAKPDVVVPPPAETKPDASTETADTPSPSPETKPDGEKTMDDATFKTESDKVHGKLTAGREYLNTTQSRVAWSDAEETELRNMMNDISMLIANANTLTYPAKPTEVQQKEIEALRNEISDVSTLMEQRLQEVEVSGKQRDIRKATEDLNKNGVPDSAEVDTRNFAEQKDDLQKGFDAMKAFLDTLNNEDGWQPEEVASLKGFMGTLPDIKDALVKLEATATIDAEKEVASSMRSGIEEAEASLNDLYEDAEKKGALEEPKTTEPPAPTEGGKPAPTEPKKSGMEAFADGIGKIIDYVIKLAGMISGKVSNAFDKGGVNKKNMLKVFGNVPLLGDMLRSSIQVDDIHAQIEKTFGGKDKIQKTDKDSEASNDLKKAFDAEVKPAGSTENFDQFVQKRIDAVKAAGKTEKITIEDLVNIKPIETPKPDEKKPDAGAKPDEGKKDEPAKNETLEKQLAALNDAKAVNEGGDVWRIDADVGGGLTSVRVKKAADGKWEWSNGIASYGKFSLTAAGLTPEQIQNRKNMNDLASKLDIPQTTPVAPQYNGTPEQKAKLKELVSSNPNINQNVHMIALAKALRSMGVTTIPDITAKEKNLMSNTVVDGELKNTLKKFFEYKSGAGNSQNTLGIYLDGNSIMEGYSGDVIVDNTLVSGVDLEKDPISFIKRLATFEITDGESKETGSDLNGRALAQVPVLQTALQKTMSEFLA